MAELSKYDLFMEELLSLEKQIYVFAQKCDDLFDENESLKTQILDLQSENTALKNKMKEIEEKLSISPDDGDLFNNNSLTPEDRENIKNKISELIDKIDNHLRS